MMFCDLKKINISLVFHGIKFDRYHPTVNKELFIDIETVKHIILFLKDKGFKIVHCNDFQELNKSCSISFDDGYCGLTKFNEFSILENLPYTVFLNAYNIQNSKPFIWDLYSEQYKKNYNFLSINIKEYLKINQNTLKIIKDQIIYNPLSEYDLRILNENPNIKIASHSYSHQVMLGSSLKFFVDEIAKNFDFLKKFKKFDQNLFSLPCGLYNRKLNQKLREFFKYIYTIDGGVAKKSNVVNRISLVNSSKINLINQIQNCLKTKYKLKKLFLNCKYNLLSKIN